MTDAVLVVEDDASVREAVSMVLEAEGFTVTAIPDGADAVDIVGSRAVDLVVLDIMLPGTDGFTVCEQLRRSSSVPILMLTARSATEDLVRGLAAGADDYLTKPFVPAELVARARAALRRTAGDIATITTVRDLEVDRGAFRATRAGTPVGLTVIEFRLLADLAQHAGEAMTREALLDHVWGYDYLGDSRIVDMAVQRLRAKLGPAPDDTPYITTVRGVGYRLEAS